MELLVEDFGGVLTEVVTESSSSSKVLSGVIMSAEKRNKNGRIYPAKLMAEALEEYKTRMKGKPMLGELSHPCRSNIDIRECCIVFEDLYFDFSTNEVKGTVVVLEGDKGPGDKLAALIKSGWGIGVSSRALGEVDKSGIVKKMQIITPGDVVCNPSGTGCWLK